MDILLEKLADKTREEKLKYQKSLSKPLDLLIQFGFWNTSAVDFYLEKLIKTMQQSSSTNWSKIIHDSEVEVAKIGSPLYCELLGHSQLNMPAKLTLMLKQLGARIDCHNQLQIVGNYYFDERLSPDSCFWEALASWIQISFPKGLSKRAYPDLDETLLQIVFQLRHFIDLQNIYYIRSHYAGKTDFDKLKNYAIKTQQKLVYRDRSRFHNRVSKIRDPKTASWIKAPFLQQQNDKIKTANGLSEFIINAQTGSFVTQWDYLKTIKGEYLLKRGRFRQVTGITHDLIDSNPKHYQLQGKVGQIIANTESFNYDAGDFLSDLLFKGEIGILFGEGKHHILDMRHHGKIKKILDFKMKNKGLESDIRVVAKHYWPFPEKYHETIKNEKQLNKLLVDYK
ncbi:MULTISPECIES: DUF3114 domain-containing protein [unclassified Enterococcus]|uniref:DUF3114 domain-containing protein n=1 Tax=unclassified Enterococcus TaxID=2608891 RepID=UPI001555821A|nr:MULTISPECIES: DUF3114 domain-containing protein [unclassified Enterococcus]MBS7576046.1 DUF3114 domain-containing protein [Enterococcus sp. MMGLQ5-2]MBS7583279.1 DUF3114 domain-containing protein [Enterococcus sp. MMGLQ5-1]NPD11139.1 DUF3114 domain-containing protein [Enterococcus sp. MMGLQ5-1]NPD35882.1 DUF3114 domain-containing protein [Enterococcus sp. MMGLQ5-2]